MNYDLGPLYKTLLGIIRNPNTHKIIVVGCVTFFCRDIGVIYWSDYKEASFDSKMIDLHTKLTPFEIKRLDIKIKRMVPQILIEQEERFKKWSTILESSNEPTKTGTL